jgi:hypothetical protein
MTVLLAETYHVILYLYMYIYRLRLLLFSFQLPKLTKPEDATSKRSQHQSGTETASLKSGSGPKTGGSSGMSFFRLVAATRAWQRLAKNRRARHQQEADKPTVQYENTYRTEPVPGKEFIPERVESMLKEILEARLKHVQYSHEECRTLTTDLASIIKGKVKVMNFPRYKIVCNMVIMENTHQGVELATRCLWNASTDTFASYTYRNSSLIAVAYVHGIYLD